MATGEPVAGLPGEEGNDVVRCYERLFMPNTPLRSLFHGARRKQGRKRMAMLYMIVAELSHLEKLVPIVQQLGVRYPDGVGKWGKPGIAAVTTTVMEGIA
jgi:hypothetical protein